jgi:hypothetical protein
MQLQTESQEEQKTKQKEKREEKEEQKKLQNSKHLSDKSIKILIHAITKNKGYIYPLSKKTELIDITTLRGLRGINECMYTLYNKNLIYFNSEEKEENKKLYVCPIIMYFYKKHGEKEFIEWMRRV